MDYNITYREKDGSIQAIVSYKKGGKWRQKAQQGFKKKKLAKTWADGIVDDLKEEAEKNLELNEEYKGLTFDKFKEMFLGHHGKYREPNTLEVFHNALQYFKNLDELCMDEIGLLNVQEGVDKMIENKLLLSSMKLYVSKLHCMFDNAVNPFKIISENPVNIKKIEFSAEHKKKEKKLKALSEKEFLTLLSKIKNPKYYIAILLAGNVGLRAGEIKGITRDNIRPTEIKIDKQWKKDKDGKWGFGKLKTPNSYRDVPISPKTYRQLRDFEDRFPTDIHNRLIVDNGNLDTCINTYLQRLGLDISIHHLRHTYATKLLAKNVDYETIALYMGDDVKTVMETYSHVNGDMLERGRNVINDFF